MFITFDKNFGIMNHEGREAETQYGHDMEAEMQVGRKPRYENEDTSPTSQRELTGWYCYGIAAEVFAVCGVGKYSALARFDQGSLLNFTCKNYMLI